MPRIRIVSDGTQKGTKVVDCETGEIYRQVIGVEWVLIDRDRSPNAAIDDPAALQAVAKVTFASVPVDIEGFTEHEPDSATLIQMIALMRDGVTFEQIMRMPWASEVSRILGALSSARKSASTQAGSS